MATIAAKTPKVGQKIRGLEVKSVQINADLKGNLAMIEMKLKDGKRPAGGNIISRLAAIYRKFRVPAWFVCEDGDAFCYDAKGPNFILADEMML